MKKQIIIAAIILLVSASAGIFFYACQKDEAVKTTSSTYCATCEAENAEKVLPDIDELIAQTGIDIYALSEKEYIKKISDAIMPVLNTKFEKVQNFSQAKSIEAEMSVLTKIEDLAERIKVANEAGLYEEVLALSEQLFALVSQIEGFSFDNDIVMEPYTFNGTDFQLPVTYMENKQIQAEEIETLVSTSFPQYQTLSQPLKTQVLASAISISVTSSMSMAKTAQTNPYEECVKAAKKEYIAWCATAEALFLAALPLCARPHVLVCVGIAYAGRAADIASATIGLKRDIELCQYKYKNN
ncbi:MAG: hypothetical protein LBR51_05995 [Bacteroidales bacterium]|jgi:hypothetical protein|nr:hypothetical protein [Bacteroidales bacterium]